MTHCVAANAYLEQAQKDNKLEGKVHFHRYLQRMRKEDRVTRISSLLIGSIAHSQIKGYFANIVAYQVEANQYIDQSN